MVGFASSITTTTAMIDRASTTLTVSMQHVLHKKTVSNYAAVELIIEAVAEGIEKEGGVSLAHSPRTGAGLGRGRTGAWCGSGTADTTVSGRSCSHAHAVAQAVLAGFS